MSVEVSPPGAASQAALPASLKFRMTCVVVLLVLAATVTVAWVALVLAERDMKSVIGNQQYALLSSAAAQIDAQMAAKKLLLASLADDVPAALLAGSGGAPGAGAPGGAPAHAANAANAAHAVDAIRPAGAVHAAKPATPTTSANALDPARLRAFVALHPVVRQEFLQLHIFDRGGLLLYSDADGAGTLTLSAAPRAYLERVLAAGRPVVSPPYRSGLSGRPTVTLLQPVFDAAGQPVMLLGGSIDLTQPSFLAQIATHKPGKTGFVYLMTAQGTLVHHPDPARLLRHINANPGVNRATEMALNGYEGWTEAANKHGSVGIYSYKRLTSTDWILGARYPVDEAFAPMIAMRRHAMLAAAAFAAVAGLMAWLAIQALLKPLGRLRRHISDIRHGAAGIAVLQRGRRDEIGELSGAFHELMAERELYQQKVVASEQRLTLLTNNLPALICYLDRERRFLFLNATFRHWFGVDPGTLLGRHLVAGLGQRQYQHAEAHLDLAYAGRIASYEVKALINGSTRTLETTFVPELDAAGQVVGIYSLTQDTTRLKDIEERLTQLARVDALTGIANRLRFEEILQLAMVRARRQRVPLALAYLDIDHFKHINDTLGHGAGDAVLREFAARLVASVRASDTVARLAGDEFVVVFEQVAGDAETARLAEKIIAAVRQPFPLEGHAADGPLRVTTSMGLALHGDGEETAAALLARADAALYRAKRDGRDGYAIG